MLPVVEEEEATNDGGGGGGGGGSGGGPDRGLGPGLVTIMIAGVTAPAPVCAPTHPGLNPGLCTHTPHGLNPGLCTPSPPMV